MRRAYTASLVSNPEPTISRLSKGGFETVLIQDISVESGGERVVNRELVLRPNSAEVTVVAAPAGAELSKASASVERTLAPALLERVPLRGTLTRDVTNLMALGPAVVRVPARPEFNYVAAGQRSGRTEFLADGLDNRSGLDFALWRPIPEQVAEFQVKTNAYSAEFGRTSGVVVSVISRSGGNRFHATAWDYYSADWLAAQTLANKRAGLPLATFHEHHAGASLRGTAPSQPHLFLRCIPVQTAEPGPSAELSSPCSDSHPQRLRCANECSTGAGQTIESRQAILAGLGFLRDVYPLLARQDPIGFIPVNRVPIEIGIAVIPAANDANSLAAMARLDHRLTRRDHLTVRWQEEHWREELAQGGRSALSNRLFGPLFAAKDVGSQSSMFASLTSLIGPATVNEFRFGAVTILSMRLRPGKAGHFSLSPAFSLRAPIPLTRGTPIP